MDNANIPQHDRRDSYRLAFVPGQTTVRVTDFPAAELIDLSASGGRLVLHSAAASGRTLPPGSELEIDLGTGEVFRSPFEVVDLRPQGSGVIHLGARWMRTAPAAALQLSRFIARELERRGPGPSRLLEPKRALTVTSQLFVRNLLSPSGDRGGRRRIEVIHQAVLAGSELRVSEVAFVDGRRVLRGQLVDAAPFLADGRPYDFVISGGAAVNVFTARCLEQRGHEVTLSMPTEVRQISSRACRRIELERATANVTVSYLHPRSRRERRAAVVLNVAGDGLAFRVAAERRAEMFLGDELRDFVIHLPDGDLHGRALVRSLGDEGHAARGQAFCGTELRLGPNEAERWRRFVFACMHPNIVDGGARPEDAWQVLCAAKYVEQWTAPEARERIRAEYLRAWQSPAPEMAHSLLLGRRNTLVGTSAGTLVYPRSWLLHHLARDGRQVEDGQGQAPLKEACELISGILERLRTETDLEHFLIYLERGKRFNERLYVDFADRYFDPGKLLLAKMEVYRRSSADALPEVDAPRIAVVDATPTLLDQLSARLAATTTPIERHALALDRDQLDLERFSAACADKNHERGRRILFALEDGRARAALIAESGSEGANLFGLLNTCRVIGLEAERPPDPVRAALLAQAVAHYRNARKSHFLLFDEPDASPDVPTRLGYQFVSNGLRWIGHRDVMATWAAYLDGLLACGS